MSTNYPTSIDDGTTLPNPSGANTLNSPDHASIHANGNDAIKAVEAKVGTGSSTPANNTFLIGNGTGTSAWSSLTSAQLASRISDETGTGSAVFATTPTLVTPKVDTINESTPANGVTVDGLNIKDGALNTNNSVVTANITDAAVTTAKIATSAVTPNKLATGAAEAVVATIESTAVQTYGDNLATVGPSVTVTIGANGLALVNIYSFLNNVAANSSSFVGINISGATTIAAADTRSIQYQAYANNAGTRASATLLYTGLTPGSTTFKMQYRVDGNSGSFIDRRIAVTPL